jgi:hypothetical protein
MPRTSAPNETAAWAERRARGAAHQAAPWVEPLARAGYAAKGVVYVVVGLLAAQAAFGDGGQTTDPSGALRTILRQPLGTFLLVVVAVGLFGYALWRAVGAVADPEHAGHDAKRVAVRIGYAVSALIHAGLGVEALRLALSDGGSGGGGSGAEHWTARALGLPAGQWLVGLAGVVLIVVGLVQLREAQSGALRKRLDLSELDATTERLVVRMGQAGLAARAVVFALTGWFLIRAARAANAEEAGGLGEALAELGSANYGPWLLGAVALGLVAYGAWQVVNARYRRIGV